MPNRTETRTEAIIVMPSSKEGEWGEGWEKDDLTEKELDNAHKALVEMTLMATYPDVDFIVRLDEDPNSELMIDAENDSLIGEVEQIIEECKTAILENEDPAGYAHSLIGS